ncbi:hypothetical protein ACFQJ7_13460 [Halovenus rubra]|uniref:Transcriptional regulator n=2 Tax=Halovenus rubra TaxID=869890 RepID=A0ABD5XAU1_9EURY|nr:hypothetical protein [Halovenus rubra]
MNSEPPDIESTTLTERLVLLALADAEVRSQTPVASVDIKQHCLELAESVDTEVVSTPDESDVMRALGVLGAAPYVEEVQPETSPVGKGRPQYALDTEPADVLQKLADDNRLENNVESVQIS